MAVESAGDYDPAFAQKQLAKSKTLLKKQQNVVTQFMKTINQDKERPTLVIDASEEVRKSVYRIRSKRTEVTINAYEKGIDLFG